MSDFAFFKDPADQNLAVDIPNSTFCMLVEKFGADELIGMSEDLAQKVVELLPFEVPEGFTLVDIVEDMNH